MDRVWIVLEGDTNTSESWSKCRLDLPHLFIGEFSTWVEAVELSDTLSQISRILETYHTRRKANEDK